MAIGGKIDTTYLKEHVNMVFYLGYYWKMSEEATDTYVQLLLPRIANYISELNLGTFERYNLI